MTSCEVKAIVNELVFGGCGCYHPCQFVCNASCYTCTACTEKWEAHGRKALSWLPERLHDDFKAWVGGTSRHTALYEKDCLAAVREFFTEVCQEGK